ncbi:hypothetical protein K0M31_009898 [Melipona bicolor]|uniref:Uncharacterized protein n=1 Tax=Melipona bicolor TaxID=60889 RepID=A0AA40FMS0_9HYME|nr:hypothetical protein K0M31_009898 [Melipona bicolor]
MKFRVSNSSNFLLENVLLINTAELKFETAVVKCTNLFVIKRNPDRLRIENTLADDQRSLILLNSTCNSVT